MTSPARALADASLSPSERLAHLWQTLQHWPWLETLATLRQRFREDRLGVTASSLTFTTLISLVPLFTVMLAIFSAFPMFGSFQAALQKYFLQSLVPDEIAKPVLAALTQFASKANRLGAVGLAVLFISALALMLTIDRTLNNIWRVRTPRPIAQRVLVYWAAATLGPFLLGVSLSLTAWAVSASRQWVGELPGGVTVLLDALEFGLLAAAMAGLYHYVPNTHVRWRHAIAGGFFVAAGIELAKRALAWYISQVPSFALVYGAFATVPILLVWIYLSWVIVLLGAVIAAYAPSLSMRVARWPDGPGARFRLALVVLRELAAERPSAQHGLDAEELSTLLRIDPLQIEPMLEMLVGFDWIGRLDEQGGGRYVLLADPARTKAAPLIERLLAEKSADTLWRRAGFGDMTLAELM
jgi:membrane protein